MTPFNRRSIIKTGAFGFAAGSSGIALAVNQPKRKLGVALVGLGHYSRDLLAPALQLTSHCELRGIVTGSPEKIPIWQKKYSIKDEHVYNYENMAKVADDPAIDVIYVVVPPFLHKKYSIIGANAGKHVWCEKPMAMTANECQEIMQACNKNKVHLTIGYRLHHEPNTQTVMKFAETQPYGKIQTVVSQAGYAGSGGPQSYWRMNRDKGGGALYDMGVYPINAARYSTGLEPIAVRDAKLIRHRPELFINADETAQFTLEFPGGITVNCETSVGKNMNQLVINAEKGWYRLQPMQSYNGVKGETSDGKKLDKTIANQQAAQMDNDSLAIINNTNVRVPGSQGLNDIKIVEAVLTAAKTKKRTEIG